MLLALFFGVYFLDNLSITLTNHLPALQLVPNRVWEGFLVYGWSGKLYSILLAIALLFLLRPGLTREEVGLTLRQNEGFILPASLVVLALAAWVLIVGLCSPKGRLDVRFLIYLAVMPGLNEELIYRGYLLAIMNRLLSPKFKLFAAPVGWGAILTSVLFGLLHGVWLDNSLDVELDMIALRNSTVSGLVFAWLRERTGNLLMPIVAHGLEDVLFFLPRML
jgi:membrane protease YdiL (CAAX protease family)